MYAGHLALGLAIKSRFHDVPAAPIMFGAGLLDIVNGIFIAGGIDKVKMNLATGPYMFTDLTFVDWDHSLLMAIIWSLVWGAVFIRNKKVAVIAALAVFTHFIIDIPVHNNDLAIYPYSASHIGFGLWGSLGIYSWVLEGIFCALLVAYAWYESARRGVSLLWPALLLAVLFIQLSPWLSPLKIIANGAVSEPFAHIVMGSLTAIGFIVPALLMTWFINRAERVKN